MYFFPVYYILMTAFKTRPDALAMPIKFLFTPTLENFYSVFVRADIQGGDGTTDPASAIISSTACSSAEPAYRWR